MSKQPSTCNDNKDQQLNAKIVELENIYLHEAKGAQIRSRAQWVEEGEKNTKYFLGLEKHNGKKRQIKSLRRSNGAYATSTSEILNEETKPFENLHSK